MWGYLLIASLLASIWNWRLALVFAAQLVSMQFVKWYDPGNIQIAFLAIHTVWAVVAFFLLEKVGAFFLAIIGAIYALHILGVVQQYPKIILSEVLFIAGLILGGYYGTSNGLLYAATNASDNEHYGGLRNMLFRFAGRFEKDNRFGQNDIQEN